MGAEADPAQHLRGPAIASPQTSIRAIEGVEIFARLGRPGANAALGTADFEDIRDVRTRGNAPIEAIAAKIGQAPAATDILLQCVKRVRCAGNPWSQSIRVSVARAVTR